MQPSVLNAPDSVRGASKWKNGLSWDPGVWPKSKFLIELTKPYKWGSKHREKWCQKLGLSQHMWGWGRVSQRRTNPNFNRFLHFEASLVIQCSATCFNPLCNWLLLSLHITKLIDMGSKLRHSVLDLNRRTISVDLNLGNLQNKPYLIKQKLKSLYNILCLSSG